MKKTTKEELVLNKQRRKTAAVVDKVLHALYIPHSILTLRRFRKLKKEPKKVLVYASMFIGEVIIALEALESIKKKYPDTTFVINKSTKSFFKDWKTIEYTPPWFNYGEKITFRGASGFFKFIRKLKKEKYDLAIDLRGDMRNNMILYLSKARKRVGYGNTGGKFFLTESIPLTDKIEYQRINKIARAVGAKPKDFTKITLSKKDKDFAKRILKEKKVTSKDKFIVIIPSAGYWTKVWPKRKWAEIITRLHKEKVKCILLGSPADKEYSEITKITEAPVINLIGQLSLMQSAAVMQQSNVVIGNDSGGMHLAAAVGSNTLSLFGPTYFERWQQCGSGVNDFISINQYCSPCGRLNSCPIDKECMRKIMPGQVMKKIKVLLK